MGRKASDRTESTLISHAVDDRKQRVRPSCCAGGRRCMPTKLASHRAVPLMMTMLVMTSAGCAAIGASDGAIRDNRSAPGEFDVDPTRAYRSLADIEPAVSKPAKPESVRPLSERASRQITKARKLANEQRYTEAGIELERALRYDPDHPQIHRALATLHWQAGNLERARIHVAKALEGNSNDATAHYLGGRCHALGGDIAGAITAYRTALLCDDFGRDPEIAALCHYELAQSLAKERYLEAALSQFTAFEAATARLDGEGTNPELRALLMETGGSAGQAKSKILEKLGRFAQAAEALAELVAGSKEDTTLGLRYARLLLRAGRLDDALAAARAMRGDDNGIVDLLFEIHTAAGRPNRIIEDLRTRIADRPGDPRPVVDLVEVLTRLGRPEDARHELQSYLDRHPEARTVRARLADLLIEQSAWGDALEVCADGMRQHPDHAATFEDKIIALASNKDALARLVTPQPGDESAIGAYLRGTLAASARRWDRAEAFLRPSHRQKPDFVPGRVALATVYLQKYRYEEALAVAGRAVEDRPEDPRLELVLGKVYERLDDLERAELHLKAATQLDRTNTDAMFELAKLHRRSGDRLRAQRQLQVLLEKDPDHEAARELLAFSYLEDNKRDVAVEQFKELEGSAIIVPRTKARVNGLLDQLRRPAPDPEAYRQTLLEAIEQYGPDAATWIAVADSYQIDEAPEQRLEAFRNALAVDPDSEEAALGVVEASQRMLAFEDAAGQLAALLPRRPNRHSWRLGLIELHLIIQDFEAALTLAETAEARDDLTDAWHRRYRLAIVDVLRLTDRPDEVPRRLRQWTKAEAVPFEWSTRLAGEYLRQDQPEQAVAIYEGLYEGNPDKLGLSFTLAEALIAAGRYDRASQYVLDWLDDDPENENALFRLAHILTEAKRYDDAVELIRNRLLHTFAREEHQDLLVSILVQAQRYDDALDLIERLMDEAVTLMRTVHDLPADASDEGRTVEERARRPNEPITFENLYERLTALRRNLATVLIMAKEYRTAETQLVSWLDASREPSERFELLRRLGMCHQVQGDEVKANEIFARALLLNPGDVMLNNDVAYGWIDRGVRLEEAGRMIRYALSRRPRQAAYLDTYGWLLYKKAEFAEAKKWLERAAGARVEVDPVILDHLGDTCWRLGALDEATGRWTEAVEKVRKRDKDDLLSADERRVRDTTWQKVDDASAGRSPKVAPLAVSPDEQDDDASAEDPDP